MILNLQVRNVNDGYMAALQAFGAAKIEPEGSRNGPVLRYPTPVCVTYERPNERVLFNAYRDANPFFHFMEGLWMLAGRRDAAFVDQFAAGMGGYSDDGSNLHGAYGYRWAFHFGVDQLTDTIAHFKKYRNSRRVVIAMYDPATDSYPRYEGKDVPCNTHIYFAVRGTALDMTVMARSNDLVWGALGANAVHMSMLHEYIAAACSFDLGSMYQFSNDYHIYTDKYDLTKLMDNATWENPYNSRVKPYPLLQLGADPLRWLRDCESFCDGDWTSLEDPFWKDVAIPMRKAWDAFVGENALAAGEATGSILASDWRAACYHWLRRRYVTSNQ
jgi:Thymidylate synthase